jgi:hypothetical protein
MIELANERVRGISLVDDSRKAKGGGDLELSAKCSLLFRKNWGCSRKIKPSFSNGNGVQNFDCAPQVASQRSLILAGQLGMQTESEINVSMSISQCA